METRAAAALSMVARVSSRKLIQPVVVTASSSRLLQPWWPRLAGGCYSLNEGHGGQYQQAWWSQAAVVKLTLQKVHYSTAHVVSEVAEVSLLGLLWFWKKIIHSSQSSENKNSLFMYKLSHLI